MNSKKQRNIKKRALSLLSVLDGDTSYYAASLSFYSILSLIPMLWVVFFILQQLGVFEKYYALVKAFLVDSLIPNHAEMIANYLEGFLVNADSMGSMGLVYIIIASVLFYSNFQYVVNKIYKVPNRSLLHSVATYLILAVLMPATLGMSFYLSDYVQSIMGEQRLLVGEFTVLSYIMVWMLFFVLFKVSPNMKIDNRITLKVSFVVSIVWHIAKWLFVQYTLVNQTYTTLYGSFSALLFLLVWIYVSWMLLLYGLKVGYLMHCHK